MGAHQSQKKSPHMFASSGLIAVEDAPKPGRKKNVNSLRTAGFWNQD
jgi:hypothetical protein